MLFLNLYRIIDMINHKSKLVCQHLSHEQTITQHSTFCQYFLEFKINHLISYSENLFAHLSL